MARLLMKALDAAGFPPDLASDLRTFDKGGERQVQESLMQRSIAEASRLIDHYGTLPVEARPALWFTYHVYYKAPDWIGPCVSRSLNIPYVVAEGSRAAKRAQGPWALAHEGAEEALDHARTIFVMTSTDRIALERSRPPHQSLIDLPPFLDAAEWPASSSRRREDRPRLLTVAMMREGDKLASYRLLAKALEQIAHLPWLLDIVGDGEARPEIESLFAAFAARVRFHGQIESKSDLAALYESADLFVWPAVNEAYGMAFLEAQLFGCAVVAGDFGGVASVVQHEKTGLLTPPGDAAAFADAVRHLIEDPERLSALGTQARRFVRAERTLDGAAKRLREALSALIPAGGIQACAF